MKALRRYRLSYRHGVIEDDGSPRACDDSKPMYLATEADALIAQLRAKLCDCPHCGKPLDYDEAAMTPLAGE